MRTEDEMLEQAPLQADEPRLLRLLEEEEEIGDANDNVEAGRVPGFVLVARFLQAVVPARVAVLRPLLLIPPRPDGGHGRLP